MSITFQTDGFPERLVALDPNCGLPTAAPIERPLGNGTFGAVYNVPQHDNMIVKIIKLGDETNASSATQSEADFQKEVQSAERAGLLGIGPEVQGYHICPGVFEDNGEHFKFGFLYLSKLSITLNKYIVELNTIPKTPETKSQRTHLAQVLAQSLVELRDLCLREGVYNHDLHPGNIMMDLNADLSVKRAYMIDCMSCFFDADQAVIWEKWNKILKQIELSLMFIMK